MKLFVGLGNPGQQYQMNRHNIGFMVLDEIANTHSFGPWRSKFSGHFSEGLLGNKKTLLLKPSTFMNLSANRLVNYLGFTKLTPII